MCVWRFSSVYFISIATILGTGILGLPVTLYNCGFLPFFVVFTVVLFAQICVVFAFVELLQRTDASLSKLTTELHPINTSNVEAVDFQLITDSSINRTATEQTEDSSTGKKFPHTSISSVRGTTLSEGKPAASLFTMSALYLKNPLIRFLFELTVLVHFVSIMTSYALAAPQSFRQFFGLDVSNSFTTTLLFVLLCSFLVCFVLPGALNVVSIATALKGSILIVLIALVTTVSLRVGQSFQNRFNYLFDSFLIGTVSLGSVVNIMPVTWSQLGSQKDNRTVKLYRISVVLAVVTCYILCTVWCLAILLVVPQSSSVDSLQTAYKLGQISTIPLVSQLHQVNSIPNVVSFLVNGFICLSTTVSFLVMGSGLKSALDGLAFRWTRLETNEAVFSPRWKRLGENKIRGVLYFCSFGLIALLAASNPHSFMRVLEGFTSLCLNTESGLFVGWMLLSSSSVINSMELMLPMRKNTIVILGYFIEVFFALAIATSVIYLSF
ncbi:uncharacterized protein Gasu_11070 [Galdieria sulphuraria]|uniref:Amino acid transporter, AAAP family n=1 Tax=Galdieria sulphuraria TaxID=130081 RepID=M2W7D7_GALSU|nr:uncharacterized protein Gasu_11070 [Galdieria sulphuraria]EME31731.1 hypothetical protein Gasu_11070 [Galdieria sulphuraria]|eukprot:XP_005708251.1 hypothetical protein Gasu_11070 [Galdieria sulphuraria]